MSHPEFINLTQPLILSLFVSHVIWTIIHSFFVSSKVSQLVASDQIHLSNSHKPEPITSGCLEPNLYELWYLAITKVHCLDECQIYGG